MVVSWIEGVDGQDGKGWMGTYIAFLQARHVHLDAVVAVGKSAAINLVGIGTMFLSGYT